MKQYTYRAMWSPTEQCYIGHCLEFPGLRGRGQTAGEAIAAVERLVNEDVAGALAADWKPPDSLTDREYSGKFVLRLTPELHAHLAVEAAEQRVSLNQWVVQKLVNRQDRHDF
ncbi:toxin-antitoxin system HicB family antitoxin [Mycobacterium sp. AMU20-3851]|uniref:type II toxin-antitoxin system HicB family antitoxin n=1 Tax=Mycobacterium sp. AMU20-3851 TaxID=3122055 RepID=UPI0037548F6D